jgi:hypothetical protein
MQPAVTAPSAGKREGKQNFLAGETNGIAARAARSLEIGAFRQSAHDDRAGDDQRRALQRAASTKINFRKRSCA